MRAFVSRVILAYIGVVICISRIERVLARAQEKDRSSLLSTFETRQSAIHVLVVFVVWDGNDLWTR